MWPVGSNTAYSVVKRITDHFSAGKMIKSTGKGPPNNIFKPLLKLPTSQKDGVKRFVMFPKNDMDWTNPMDILYMAAEAIFLRMVDRSPKISGNITRKSILSIEYIENQSITTSYLAKQDNFLAKWINSKKKALLPWHTYLFISNIDNILKENFSDTKMKRCAYGRGHYFSEFPDVSAGYEFGLLLCRVLLGSSWTVSSPADIKESKTNWSILMKMDGAGSLLFQTRRKCYRSLL